jgi:CheY-like chemotaxis protein
MPGMDGLTAAREIRSGRPNQSIILYTAYLDPKLETQAKAAGIAMCIGKVQGLNQLERHITELCRDLGAEVGNGDQAPTDREQVEPTA